MRNIFKKEKSGKYVTYEDFSDFKEETNKKLMKQDKRIKKLEAENFKLKCPNGKLELSYPNFMSFNRYLKFTYAYNEEIHTVNIEALSYQYRFYKVVIDNNKVHIGISFGDETNKNDAVENYFVVDMSNETAISLGNEPTVKLSSEKWIKAD